MLVTGCPGAALNTEIVEGLVVVVVVIVGIALAALTLASNLFTDGGLTTAVL